MHPDFWNERYRTGKLIYGARPNAFVAEQCTRLLDPDVEVIELGAGEGRNAAFLAEQGFRVTAVDYAEIGLEKARRLAAERGVTIETVPADIRTWQPRRTWDAVIVTFLHLLPQERIHLYRLIQELLRPGGVLVAEWFRPEQVTGSFQSGGPRDVDLMVTLEELERHFPSSGIMLGRETIVELDEGTHHHGPAAVVQFVWRKAKEGDSPEESR